MAKKSLRARSERLSAPTDKVSAKSLSVDGMTPFCDLLCQSTNRLNFNDRLIRRQITMRLGELRDVLKLANLFESFLNFPTWCYA